MTMSRPAMSRPATLALALSAAATMMQSARAQPAPQESSLVQSLLAAEDREFQAEIRADAPAIAAGFADGGTFTHANGTVDSKQDYIAAIVSGHLAFRSIVPARRVAWAAGTLGVTHADMSLVVGDRHLSGSYTAVYRLRDGRWQLVDWQSSGPPHPVN